MDGFEPRPGRIGFLVNGLAVGQVSRVSLSPSVFSVLLSVYKRYVSSLRHVPEAMQQWQLTSSLNDA